MRMVCLPSMAAAIRFTATRRPLICSGGCRWDSEGARKRKAESESVMPRRSSKLARMDEESAGLNPRPNQRSGCPAKAEARVTTADGSVVLSNHFICGRVRWCGRNSVEAMAGRSTSALFLLVGLVNRNAAKFIRYFQQALVALVPLGADLTNKHRALISPAQLQVANLAQVSTQPARVFNIVAIGELRVGQPLHQFVKLSALEHPGVGSEKGSACSLGQLHKILPAIGIRAHVPHDALDLVVVHKPMETPHAVAFDEGDHVVFERGQVVGRGRHKLVAKGALYAVPKQAASGREPGGAEAGISKNRLRFSKRAVHQHGFWFASGKASSGRPQRSPQR